MTESEPAAPPPAGNSQPDVAKDHLRDVVAIDGPSGAGKSSVARALAQRLGFSYLDTGAMYRAVTWHFLQAEVVDSEEVAVAASLADLHLRIRPDGGLEVNGRDVSSHLRSREVESRVSAVSALPAVRKAMRALQRAVASAGPVVAEGRDMASVVFPAARWKFYLDADVAERARRRQADFERQGRAVSMAEVTEEIEVRDSLDSNRKDAPLVRSQDADYVDTTGLEFDEVVETLAQRVERGASSPTA